MRLKFKRNFTKWRNRLKDIMNLNKDEVLHSDGKF